MPTMVVSKVSWFSVLDALIAKSNTWQWFQRWCRPQSSKCRSYRLLLGLGVSVQQLRSLEEVAELTVFPGTHGRNRGGVVAGGDGGAQIKWSIPCNLGRFLYIHRKIDLTSNITFFADYLKNITLFDFPSNNALSTFKECASPTIQWFTIFKYIEPPSNLWL